MAVANFTLPFVGTPPYFSGTGSTNLVPSVFPVAINGRPYMIDQKSGKFARGYEQRVRDSQDISTAPGEGAINPGGLWRRGQDSWHYGAGQKYADVAESQDFRFYKSKGINPWTKGEIGLLNTTKRVGGTGAPSTNTNLHVVSVKSNSTEYIYVSDGSVLKYITNDASTGIFSANPTWTSVTTGSPGTAITTIETNGSSVFVAYTNNDIYVTTPGSASVTIFYPISGAGSGKTYTGFSYAKGWGIASVANALYVIGSDTGQAHAIHYTARDTSFRWIGAAAGQNAVYVGGYSGTKSLIYKMTLKADGSGFDAPIVALELPSGEVISSIYGYLGYIFLGTNKGVRFCTTDGQNNLVAGPIIPTTGNVIDFSSDGRYVWFGYTNYDGVSGGLGRLDLSVFTSTNAPAFATDLMYDSTNNVRDITKMADSTGTVRRIFSIDGVGIIIEDTSSLVASGEIELGLYRWGIPDRKFVAKVDVRSEPLKGSVTPYLSNDLEEYSALGIWDNQDQVEVTFNGSDVKAIESRFKLDLHRSTTNVAEGPVVTRWMGRAYAAPFRSQVFSVPVLLHNKVRLPSGRDLHLDVQEETDILDAMISSPRIVILQIGESKHSVIVEDIEWLPVDSYGKSWNWEGTATVTMRSVEN